MMNFKNNMAARLGYQNAKETLFKAWIGSFGGNAEQCNTYINSLKLSENSIRTENLLTANNTNYIFAVIPEQNNTSAQKFKTEDRLKPQDTLIVTSYQVLVGLTTGLSDVNFDMQPWANPAIFGAADAALINNVLYANSKLKITVNNDVIVPGRFLSHSRAVPETQLTAAPGAGSPITQIEGGESGLVATEPNLYLIGSKGSVPEIILPSAMVGLSTELIRIALVFNGYLAQNSTVQS